MLFIELTRLPFRIRSLHVRPPAGILLGFELTPLTVNLVGSRIVGIQRAIRRVPIEIPAFRAALTPDPLTEQ